MRNQKIAELLHQYFELGVAEGREGRNHDTKAGDAQRVLSEIEAEIATLSAVEPVSSIVPDHCSGTALVFQGGCLHVRTDGSGHIVVDEDDFKLEDDRCEGEHGPEGSVHWIARFPAGEMIALRNFLNGQDFPAPSAAEPVRCEGCDGYNCDDGCAYPTPAPSVVVKTGEATARLQRALDAANPNHKTMWVYVDDLRSALSAQVQDVAGWCQPGDVKERTFLVSFEDASNGVCVFHDEAEARKFFADASVDWNCYLFGALPAAPAKQEG